MIEQPHWIDCIDHTQFQSYISKIDGDIYIQMYVVFNIMSIQYSEHT